jgi:uncharacterized pyridoxamine 5'-phosphate oxidase family protein
MSQILFPEDAKFQELLQKKIPIRFSCVNSSGWPVILSLWYIQKDGKIYCATQKNAKVIEYLQENPKCAFEIAQDKPPYLGISGRGKAVLREDIAFKILELLIFRYLGNQDSSLAKFLLSQSENEIAIEITPSKLFSWDYSKRMK